MADTPVDTPVDVIAPADEAPPQSMMPPREESGFPSLPWAAAGANELFHTVTPTRMFTMSCSVRDSLSTTVMGMQNQGQTAGQLGLQYASPLGMLKVEGASQGMVNVSLEGFQPLPIMQLNTVLGFVGGMLACGELKSVLMTPFGLLMGSANVFGQMSAEFFTGLQPADGHQLMVGTHVWGLPGVFGGVKVAAEWTREVVVAEELQSQCAITAAVTRPYLSNDGSPGVPSFSLTMCHRPDAESTLALQYEGGGKDGAKGGVLSVAGARQLSEAQRLKARWNTQGLLGVALEQAGQKHMLSFIGEIDTSPTAAGLSPKFGVNLQLGL